MLRNLQAILFDSGRVLNTPRTGNWFIPPNFYKYVDETEFNLLNRDAVESAFQAAFQYLSQQNFVLTEAAELKHFVQFYRIFSNKLPSLQLTETDVVEVARDTVYNDDKFYFYEDVFEKIPQLSRNYKLGIVSDTWPSLERVFRNVGLRHYFSTFVMSSVIGAVKPDRLMFTAALSELHVKPEDTLFIDDNVTNLESAREIGLQTILMRRGEPYGHDSGFLKIGQLKDLFNENDELIASV